MLGFIWKLRILFFLVLLGYRFATFKILWNNSSEKRRLFHFLLIFDSFEQKLIHILFY